MNSDFVTWLTATITQQGWTWSELARRAAVSPAAISMIISGKNQPGNELCLGAAKALGLPPEAALRYAGGVARLTGTGGRAEPDRTAG